MRLLKINTIVSVHRLKGFPLQAGFRVAFLPVHLHTGLPVRCTQTGL
ncbi:MAG: hypothetical protein JXA79_12205 [Deltaproteobacteria bacterium]|nr:hypothetical protein [Deltaproteobacteria bacterium]